MNDDQFTKLFNYMEKRFDEVGERFDKQDKRFDNLTSLIDGYAGHLGISHGVQNKKKLP